MSMDERIELQTMGREITEEEQKELKKDALGKSLTGLIVVLVVAVVLSILAFVIPEMVDSISESDYHLHLRGKSIRKIMIFLAALAAGIALYMVSTLKTAFEALPQIKKSKVIEVNVIDIKEKQNVAYKNYGVVTVYINGTPQNIDIPILNNHAKYVRWQKKGKLYFVPDKFYILGKSDS